MQTCNNDTHKGIKQLFPILCRDENNDYSFGVYTLEDAPDCYFRVSFDCQSELYASGVEPELIITIDSRIYSKEERRWIIEEKRFCYCGIKDLEEPKKSWIFQITERDLRYISEADCIISMEIKKRRFRLDLLADSPDIWIAFFRAVVAECINEEEESRELSEFCLQYGLARKKLKLEKAIEARNIKPTELADMLSKTDGSIDDFLTLAD